MSLELFSLEEVRLLENAVASYSTETSRKLMDTERIPQSSGTVANQVRISRSELNNQLDALALIKAKLITNRQLMISAEAPAPSESEQE